MPPHHRSPLFPYTTLFRSGLFEPGGRIIGLREDVGRHNALDKLVGGELLARRRARSEEHTSELQSRLQLVCRLLLEKKKTRPPVASTSSTRHQEQPTWLAR